MFVVSGATLTTEDVKVGATDRTVVVPVPVDVPEIVMVPEVVIGDPETDSQAGTAMATDDTYTVGVTYDNMDPLEVRTVPVAPTVVKPVPPDVVGIAVPE